MGTLDSKKLRDALSKAKGIGIVEETFTLGDCEVTLRNLRPDEYTAVMQACQGLDNAEYLHAYQKGHLARSIVSLNGIDFHDVDFVEIEEPDPKNPNKIRPIKVELHSYLMPIVDTWGKEVVYAAYRKFGDVVSKAERQATEGITFLLPEETDEEKYRRLLLEAKESEEQLPGTLVDRILDESGLMRKSTSDEIKSVMEKTDQLAREQAAAESVAEVAPVATADAAPTVQAAPQPAPRPADPHHTLQQAIAERQRPVAQPVTPVVRAAQEDSPAPPSRSAKIAALEGGAEVEFPTALPSNLGLLPVVRPDQQQEPVEITHKRPAVDPQAAAGILDRPPTAGINPRFRPPQRA